MHQVLNIDWFVVCWLCLTSHRQQGHLETGLHLLSLAKDVKLGFYTTPPGIEPKVVAWQSITLPLRHVSSTLDIDH